MAEITLDSTLEDIITRFVMLDPDHALDDTDITIDLQTIKVVWPDTSRVRLDISVMSTEQGAVAMMPSASVEVPGGGNINNPAPAPVLNSLNPSTIAAGGTGFTLEIDGTGFVGGSRVFFGTAVATATFVDEDTLTMNIGPDGYAQAGTIPVTVESPGGNASNELDFTIT